MGVEIVAVTALEANNPTRSLKWPAKYISYLIAFIYVFCTIIFYLNVGWQNPSLPSLRDRIAHGTLDVSPTSNTTTTSTPIVIIAVLNANIGVLPDILNVFLIIAVLSTANTALYVSSRTLYGLTRAFNPKSTHWWVRGISKLSITTPERKVPGWALFVSAGIFCWVPFLRLSTGVSGQNVCSYHPISCYRIDTDCAP